MAAKPPQTGALLSGLLVQKDFSYTLLSPSELKDFTGLGTTEIKQKQNLRLNVSWEIVRWHLEGMYGEVEEGVQKNLAYFRVRFGFRNNMTKADLENFLNGILNRL